MNIPDGGSPPAGDGQWIPYDNLSDELQKHACRVNRGEYAANEYEYFVASQPTVLSRRLLVDAKPLPPFGARRQPEAQA